MTPFDAHTILRAAYGLEGRDAKRGRRLSGQSSYTQMGRGISPTKGVHGNSNGGRVKARTVRLPMGGVRHG